jgi:peptidoglycan/xylan/chitin deacetylase (PgdA/CDA1 family)
MAKRFVMLWAFLATMLVGAADARDGDALPPRRRVAITVDDLPWVEFAQSPPRLVAERHRRLVSALRGTHAIGFVNEDKLEDEGVVVPARVAMLRDWLAMGLDLGNHTYGHVGLTTTPIADYETAILRGERITRGLLTDAGRELRWFRHPFLQAGRDDATRTRLAAFLATHGYRVAPVTVDNGDWIFARAYVIALDVDHDEAAAAQLRERYVAYIEAKFQFFEQNAKRLFGREIAQIHLLHASALNADAMADVLAMLRRRGYAFVSLDDALADPAYAHDDGYRGGAGISWLHRWAMAEKKPRAFYDGEPVVPADVMRAAGVDGE